MTDADRKMAALRLRFLDRARADGAQLTEALAAMDRGRLLMLAHGLAGIAGIFGYAQISAQAAALETAIDEAVEDAVVRRLTSGLIAALEMLGQPDG